MPMRSGVTRNHESASRCAVADAPIPTVRVSRGLHGLLAGGEAGRTELHPHVAGARIVSVAATPDSSLRPRSSDFIDRAPPIGSMRDTLITPSSRNGNRSESAFDLPEPLRPRSTSRPPPNSNTWSSYSQMLKMPARFGRQRPVTDDSWTCESVSEGQVRWRRGRHRQNSDGAEVGAGSEAVGSASSGRGPEAASKCGHLDVTGRHRPVRRGRVPDQAE